MAIPSSFPEQVRTLDPPKGWSEIEHGECAPLPIYSDGFQCVSLWRLGWRERLSALLFGRVWLAVLSGATQPPVWVKAARSVFERTGQELP
ncbi:MAG: hypothetical protein AB7P08_17115 [Burkholderiales bacterium]